MTDWTPERTGALTEHWLAGMSGGQIARKLGGSAASEEIRVAAAPARAGCCYPVVEWADRVALRRLRAADVAIFCGAPRRTRSSYCGEHHAACWVPVPARKGSA